MIEQGEYKPISCDLYDHLEIAAMKGTKVKIVYYEEGLKKCVLTVIKTLKTINHNEYLYTSENHEIRLDKLINIHDENGVLLVSFEHKAEC